MTEHLAPQSQFTDAQFGLAMRRAVKTGVVLAVIAILVVWWKMEWRSAILLAVGAAISISGLWEWRRLMTAVAARMDAETNVEGEHEKGTSLGFLLAVFFLRLLLALVVLYVTLKYLHGSVFALAAGLMAGILALLVEALRLLRTWTL